MSQEEAEYVLGSLGPHAASSLANTIYNALDKAGVAKRSATAELGREKTRSAR